MAITLSAYKRGCKIVGGIKRLLLINKDDREAKTIVATDSNGVKITAFTLVGAVKTDAYEILPRENAFSFTQPETGDNTAGTSFVTQTLEGMLHGLTATTLGLSKATRKCRFEAIIFTNSGKILYAGLNDDGLQSVANDGGQTGAAKGDAQGVMINLVSEGDEAPLVELAGEGELTDGFTIITT